MARTAHTYSAQAIVLRNRNLGEKDRIMTLLSPDFGKFSAVAKGARAPKSKLAAVSQAFTHARFLIARGRSLDIATQAEIEDAHIHISGDLLRTAWATCLCELCDAIPEHQPDTTFFETLCIALQALNNSTLSREDIELAGAWFETRLLSLLGYSPTLSHCAACAQKIVIAPEEANRQVAFSLSLGGTLCSNCFTRDSARISVLAQALRVLHRLERMAQPPRAAQCEMTTATQRDLQRALRGLMSVHLDMRPRSQKFLDEVSADLATVST
jgi:DNA repair protein RecO (recombination protein O)